MLTALRAGIAQSSTGFHAQHARQFRSTRALMQGKKRKKKFKVYGEEQQQQRSQQQQQQQQQQRQQQHQQHGHFSPRPPLGASSDGVAQGSAVAIARHRSKEQAEMPEAGHRPDLLARALVNSVFSPGVHEIEMEHDAGRAVDARGGDVVEETCRAPRRFVIVARDAVIVGLEAPE